MDAQGNLYVADSFNHRVLEYDTPATTDAVADRVFGQPDFTSNIPNNGGVSANSLLYPFAVALDAQGNLYVADSSNSRVLEYDAPLTTDAVADRVFGQPDFTSNNSGVGPRKLDHPVSVALDGQGNLYVADLSNHRVLEYDIPLEYDDTADLVIGQPDFTSNDANHGGLSASSLSGPYSAALDTQGNLYISDQANNRVLEYDAPLPLHPAANRVFGQPDFTSNLANNGGLSAHSLDGPVAIVLDAKGNLYVMDENNNRGLEYNLPLTTNTTADLVFGQPDFTSNLANNGGVSADSLHYPTGVAVDPHSNLYVADIGNNRVLEYDVPKPYGVPALTSISPSSVPAGGPAITLTVTGSGFVDTSIVRWNGSDRPTLYHSSTRLSASISAGDVAHGGPFAVTVFTPAPGGGTSTLRNLDLYTRSGQDPAADVELGQPGFLEATINNPALPGGANRLYAPGSLVIDSNSKRLFVADSNNGRVLSWPNAPAFMNGQAADLVIGQPDFISNHPNDGGLSASSLFSPAGLAVDAQGNLYVSDSFNHRVLEYNAPLTSGMAASMVFGQGGSFTTNVSNNGGISANSLFWPEGIALDAQGNLYVADQYNNRVLEYDTPLTTDTTADLVIGQPDFTTSDSNTTRKGLALPTGVAVDHRGNLYVADSMHSRALEYDAPLTNEPAADRVFGQPDFTSNLPNNGGLSASSLYDPSGVALDAREDLYVADTANHRVLVYEHPLASDAVADRVFGQPDFNSNAPNNGLNPSASGLNNPSALTVDALGNLYVADSNNHRVLEYDAVLFKVFAPLITR